MPRGNVPPRPWPPSDRVGLLSPLPRSSRSRTDGMLSAITQRARTIINELRVDCQVLSISATGPFGFALSIATRVIRDFMCVSYD